MILKFCIVIIFIFGGFLIIKRMKRIHQDIYSVRRPEFFFRQRDYESIGVPVFTYHSIGNHNTPDSISLLEFEAHLDFIKNNHYKTITANELYQYITFNKSFPKNSIALTFDDGRASLWAVVYPLIMKYDVKIIGFINPGLMREYGVRSKLDDETASPSDDTFERIQDIDNCENPLITWEEARLMHKSKLVDFQSHTLMHNRIPISPKVIDFINPKFSAGFNNYQLPLYHNAYKSNVPLMQRFGTPIFMNDSRMGPFRRYIVDPGLCDECLDYVSEHGNNEFFLRDSWWEELMSLCQAHLSDNNTYESKIEQIEEITMSLSRSREIIQSNLPGKIIQHLCFPWHRYSSIAMHLARLTGYKTSWIDINPQNMNSNTSNPYKTQKYIPVNSFGMDPFFISRIDARDNIVLSLPGKGRRSISRRIITKLFKKPQLFRSNT